MNDVRRIGTTIYNVYDVFLYCTKSSYYCPARDVQEIDAWEFKTEENGR